MQHIVGASIHKLLYLLQQLHRCDACTNIQIALFDKCGARPNRVHGSVNMMQILNTV